MSKQPLAGQATEQLERAGTAVEHGVDQLVDAGHALAVDTISDVRDSVQQLRAQASPLIAQLNRTASDALEQATDIGKAGLAQAREASAQLSAEAQSLAERAKTYIQTQPAQAMAIAALGGAAIAIALRYLGRTRAQH